MIETFDGAVVIDTGPVAAQPGRLADALPVAPRAPARTRPRLRPRTIRRLVGAVLLVWSIIFAFDRVIGPMMYASRQEHLAASFDRPSATISSGDALVLLQAPTIDLNAIVVEDVDVDNLRGAPAHLAGSALPGDVGVMVVYGHRDTYGSPFAHIDDLARGDSVIAQARNQGPIIRYIVDRVERGTSVTDVQLDTTDLISYLVLVTDESKWSGGEQTVLVARALPVTDAPPVAPDLGAAAAALPFGLDIIFALGAGVAAYVSWAFLRRRSGMASRVMVVAPMAAFALIRVCMALDSVLPIAR